MATIVNNPPAAQESSGGGYGFLIGVIVLVFFGLLFFLYGLPMITNSMSTPQVAVPDQIDVNVNTPQK